MRKLLVVLAVLVVIGFPVTAKADNLGFDLGVLSYNPQENTAENGTGSFVCISFPVDSTMSVGFYNEGLTIQLKNDLAAAPSPTVVAVDASITAVQVVKKVSEKANVGVGLNLGMADINAYIAGALAWTTTAPVADVFLKWAFLTGGDKSVKTDISATLGYRNLLITSTDPDGLAGDFTKAIDNLNGFYVGLSLGVTF